MNIKIKIMHVIFPITDVVHNIIAYYAMILQNMITTNNQGKFLSGEFVIKSSHNFDFVLKVKFGGFSNKIIYFVTKSAFGTPDMP